MVRYLVREDCQRCDDAQLHVGHEGRGNQHTVSEAVHTVACEHGPSTGQGARWPGRLDPLGLLAVWMCMPRAVVVMLVSVVPELRLVKQKEEDQPRQQRHEQAMRPNAAFKCLGQQVHERGGQQRARRKAEHMLRVTRQHAKAEQCRQPYAADPGGQRSNQYRYQNHSCVCLPHMARSQISTIKNDWNLELVTKQRVRACDYGPTRGPPTGTAGPGHEQLAALPVAGGTPVAAVTAL